MKKRIWELDALRGLCILGMVLVHGIYDAVELYGLIRWNYPDWFCLVRDWGGIAFLLISGISVTLGSHAVRRGLTVLFCGMLCTAVTFGMEYLGLAGPGLTIWFGVLHCLGCCMLLWPLFRRFPMPALAASALLLIAAGYALERFVRVDFPWLIPLGVLQPGLVSSDYFPLLPSLGWFLLGGVLGRQLYANKLSLLPKVNADRLPLRLLRLCGRHSLAIYLLHQPVLAGIFLLLRQIISGGKT